MKLILDIPDTEQGASFYKRVKGYSYVEKAKVATSADVRALEELHEARQANRLAAKVKDGKVKTRPARQLLNEL
ncbi:hypothetical protein [Filimonas effusa]|uniref:Uncharacterized protein n=1 Tax=Filimonas effusa TaxID=2508721 RepID=A0A4Q1D4X6_9BACT|nr:hypothetical protein [Filimonas effusa]RXK83006.1 hypothetical protein ESB13_12845 [Filimonas effusa]